MLIGANRFPHIHAWYPSPIYMLGTLPGLRVIQDQPLLIVSDEYSEDLIKIMVFLAWA